MEIDIKEAPTLPGVYIFKGARDKVLYIGKAKNLRNRLRAYSVDNPSLDLRKASMVRLVKAVQWIVTDSELEALILEASLIKQHRPRFNIILRDDKAYPYLRITITEQWPKVEVVRRLSDDGNLYFGPYVPSQSMWEALSVIRRHFLIRKCRHRLDKPMRPCIQHQMKRCLAPCAGLISRAQYMSHVEDVRLFLSGKRTELIDRYRQKMEAYAEALMYEEAAIMRDKIQRLERALEQQKVISPELGDLDVIGWDFDDYKHNAAFNVLFIRKGVLIGAKDFFIKDTSVSDEAEAAESFIRGFYGKGVEPPPKVLLKGPIEDMDIHVQWLRMKRGGDVQFEIPTTDREIDIMHMAVNNAILHRRAKTQGTTDEVLMQIKERLKLTMLPSTIGVFDISTLSGSESSGGFIYWANGDFQRDLYRRVRIKTVSGVDDYSMMTEAIERILGKLEAPQIPSLLIVDGGKGHLETALLALTKLGISTQVVSIAKRPDRVFLPSGRVIDITDRQKSSILLRSLRDEAHRYVITFHREQRRKRLFTSVLEEIPGIGPKRRLALIRHFGSLKALKNSSPEEIAAVKGFDKKTAEKVYEAISKTNEYPV